MFMNAELLPDLITGNGLLGWQGRDAAMHQVDPVFRHTRFQQGLVDCAGYRDEMLSGKIVFSARKKIPSNGKINPPCAK